MLPFGVTNLATTPQRSEIPEGLMNYPVSYHYVSKIHCMTDKTKGDTNMNCA